MPIVSRHGAGMDDGDYINMQMQGAHAKLIELQSRNELKNAPIGDTGLVNNKDIEKIADGFKENKENTE